MSCNNTQVFTEPAVIRVQQGTTTGSGVLVRTFQASEISFGNPVLIGTVPPGKRIPRCVLQITSAFNHNAKITIGDVVGQGRLMTDDENEAWAANKYITEPDVLYQAGTAVYIFLPSGTPTTGQAVVIIYYT